MLVVTGTNNKYNPMESAANQDLLEELKRALNPDIVRLLSESGCLYEYTHQITVRWPNKEDLHRFATHANVKISNLGYHDLIGSSFIWSRADSGFKLWSNKSKEFNRLNKKYGY